MDTVMSPPVRPLRTTFVPDYQRYLIHLQMAVVSNISSDGILINWAVLLVLCSVLTMVQVQQEETAKDLIQAVTAVFMASAAHIWFTFKKKKKKACFASPQLCSHLLLNPLPIPHPSFLLSSPTSSCTLSFISCLQTHIILCLSLCLSISVLIPFVAPCSSFSFSFSLHYPTLSWSLSLLFQTHCSQTLSSPHINPSLPSSVAHNSIPIGFLHLFALSHSLCNIGDVFPDKKSFWSCVHLTSAQLCKTATSFSKIQTAVTFEMNPKWYAIVWNSCHNVVGSYQLLCYSFI